VELSTFTSIMSNVLTYLIILVQFHDSSDPVTTGGEAEITISK
jgi:hypothetical protein